MGQAEDRPKRNKKRFLFEFVSHFYGYPLAYCALKRIDPTGFNFRLQRFTALFGTTCVEPIVVKNRTNDLVFCSQVRAEL